MRIDEFWHKDHFSDEDVLEQLEEGHGEVLDQIIEDSHTYALIRTLSEQAVEEVAPGTDFDAETFPNSILIDMLKFSKARPTKLG